MFQICFSYSLPYIGKGITINMIQVRKPRIYLTFPPMPLCNRSSTSVDFTLKCLSQQSPPLLPTATDRPNVCPQHFSQKPVSDFLSIVSPKAQYEYSFAQKRFLASFLTESWLNSLAWSSGFFTTYPSLPFQTYLPVSHLHASYMLALRTFFLTA